MINRPVKPAIVLIPGSFSIAAMYYPLQEELQAAGHETYINLLPSASHNAPETPATLQDDANAFTKTIRPPVDQGKHVVVLGHSYGGMVASQLPLDLSEEHRRANGQQGGIVRLIYLAAIVLPVGQSVIGDQGMPPDSIVRIDKYGFMQLCNPSATGQRMYKYWHEERAQAWVETAPKQSLSSFESPLTSAAYKVITSTYILCEDDEIIPPPKQEEYVKNIEQATGREADVRRIPTGHIPNLTALETLVETVRSILKE